MQLSRLGYILPHCVYILKGCDSNFVMKLIWLQVYLDVWAKIEIVIEIMSVKLLVIVILVLKR